MIGQEIGPFKIEKELGSGAMGSVYRGIYAKTGQRVAIKIMAPGLASNEQSQKRFEREAAILKQLSHRNVVRLFGTGKHQGMRYYAMEYIEGESLDRKLARKGRLTWEEVVELGQQLCAALQHAHEAGVVHRDLKPSNLMILPDGTLKLTDFGIAKDVDATALTEANCTVGTAAYMSPEQCRGEPVTHKSDLYSMGIMFYELLTGKKPFHAESVMDMFLLHVKGSFERPSRLVPDIPKWLDTLVCQLLEKKPDKRPLDAATVGAALAEILEKVEALQSAGAEAVTGTRQIESLPDEADRDAARALRKKKKKKGEKTDRPPFWTTTGFKAAGLSALLGLLILGVWLILKPDSQAKVFGRIERQWSKASNEDKQKIYDNAIREYLRRFGEKDDDMTRKVRGWATEWETHLAREELRKMHAIAGDGPWPKSRDAAKPHELDALKALQSEEKGQLKEARDLWLKVLKDYPQEPGWLALARERMTVLDQAQTEEERLKKLREQVLTDGREPSLDGPRHKAYLAVCYEQLGDEAEAWIRWESLKRELADNRDRAEVRPWYLLALAKEEKLKKHKQISPVDAKLIRQKKVEEQVKTARDMIGRNESLLRARAICLHLLTLYRDDKDLKKLMDEAEELVKKVPR